MVSKDKALVVGLDVGTSKIVALVGEAAAGEPVHVIGIGQALSRGIKRGVVVDIEATVGSIQKAIEEAEAVAGCEIRSIYASIGGSHIRGLNSHGIVAIREKEVTEADVERVMDAAKAVPVPADQKLLHALPQEYVIDDQDGIRYPVGMSGVRLEARVHLVSAANSAAQNILKCVARCGLQVDQLILEPLASSMAVLTDDERDLGVMLVDIGAGTTDIAIWSKGALKHTAVLPVAGDQVTNDIAVALRTPTVHAEEIKVRYACALAALATADESIQVPGVGDREPRRLARQVLAEVVQPRYEELLTLVQSELRRSGFEDLVPAGVVLTGGAAKIEGLVELAEEIFHMPVRIGIPQGASGMADATANPVHATGVGLLLFGQGQARPRVAPRPPTGLVALLQRFKNWFRGEF